MVGAAGIACFKQGQDKESQFVSDKWVSLAYAVCRFKTTGATISHMGGAVSGVL